MLELMPIAIRITDVEMIMWLASFQVFLECRDYIPAKEALEKFAEAFPDISRERANSIVSDAAMAFSVYHNVIEKLNQLRPMAPETSGNEAVT
jgi:hypothetical protein